MENSTKIILVIGGAVAAYLLWNKAKGATVTSSAANQGNTLNATGGCKTPCEVGSTQTSDCRCIPPTKNAPGPIVSSGSGRMLSTPVKPPVSPSRPSIVQRGFV